VLVAGAGVAGLETVLALRALAGECVDVTLVAPELRFVDRSLAVDQPFERRRVRGITLEDAAADLGARWHRGALDRVEHARREVVTRNGDRLAYDRLVLAVGARCECPWTSQDVLTYRDGRDSPAYRLLLLRLREGLITRLAFVKPAGASWPLVLYDLALSTAADCAARGPSEVELSLVTPEQRPLGIFGSAVSAAIRRLLDDRRVALHTSSYGVPTRGGWLAVSPGQPPSAGRPCRDPPPSRRATTARRPLRSRWLPPHRRSRARRRAGGRVRRRRRNVLPGQAGRPGRSAGRCRRRGDRRLGGRGHRSPPFRPSYAGPVNRRPAADRTRGEHP
jgi:hypothetical protein